MAKFPDKLPPTLLCCDSLQVFREIANKPHKNCRVLVNGFILRTNEEINDEEVEKMNKEILDIEEFLSEQETIEKLENEFLTFETDVKDQQAKNETTPSKPTIPENETPHKSNQNEQKKRPNPSVRRELFPMENKKWPKGTFKLREIYRKFFKSYPQNSHDAEDDVMTLLKCACACNTRFVEIVKRSAKIFSDIKEL